MTIQCESKMTIGKFYQKAVRELKTAGIKTAELDAKVLLKFVLENDETFLLLHPEMLLTNYQFDKLKKLLKRRKNGEPIAYLTSHKEFFGYDFVINRNVLIPRPESEFLVEQALKILKSQVPSSEFRVLDIGTGSGCIIISLALEIEKLTSLPAYKLMSFSASDISKKALAVAKKNYKQLICHSVSLVDREESPKIRFYHSDLFSNRLLHKKYDLIIANLPYVPKSTQYSVLSTQDLKGIEFEPAEAIFANDNGAAIIKKFLTEAKKYLNKNGTVLVELDPRNAISINNFARKNYPTAKIEIKKDLAGLDRYLIVVN